MKNSRCILILAAVVLTFSAPISAQRLDAGQATLKAAIDKEMVDGDLKGAIRLYEKAVSEAGRDRATAVKALMRMAECHQKLGNAESRQLYERVLREYADQKEAAAIARARIGTLAGQRAVVTRQVWTGLTVRLNGTVSGDGRFVSYTDRTTGDLMVHDLTTGEDRKLDTGGEGKADLSNISPDGRRVAYVWLKGGTAAELRLVEIRPRGVSAPRVLYRNPDVRYPGPWAWSADSQTVAVQLQRADRTVQIALVAAENGSVRVLRTIGWGGAGSMALSPDGKFLAYNAITDPESRHSDVRVIALDGSQDSPAVTDPNSDDRPASWTPDGHHLLYLSDREGRRNLYALPIRLSKPAGSPQLIRENLSNVMGVTRSGTIYAGEFSAGANLVTAEIDLATGKLRSTPAVVSNASYEGVWSPDGRFLATGLPTGSPGQFWGIQVRSLETAQARQLAPELLYGRGLCWIGNSGQLLVNGTDLKGRRGLFRVDSQTGEAQAIRMEKEIRSPKPGRRELWPKCATDGRHVLYERWRENPNTGTTMSQLVARDLTTGAERELVELDPAAGDLRGFALSPDGEWIAYAVSAGERLGATLTIRSTRTNEFRELPVPGRPGLLSVSDWTPDGNFLVVRRAEKSGPQSAAEFLLVPVRQGNAAAIAVSLPAAAASGLTVHPGGKHIAYVSPTSPSRALGAIDNALTVLDKR